MEKPNVTYIDDLSRGDMSVKKALIDIIKQEFVEEKEAYYKSLEEDNYKKIEFNVHKIKHKIGLLGLVEEYENANEFEKQLREHQLSRVAHFDKVLKVITEYLKTI